MPHVALHSKLAVISFVLFMFLKILFKTKERLNNIPGLQIKTCKLRGCNSKERLDIIYNPIRI
jgi:hypothetical protein